MKMGVKKLIKDNKKKKPKINVLTHELLAFTLSYLILAPCWYINHSNLSFRTPPMSSLIVMYIFFYYRFVLLPHYKLVPLQASVGYVQTILNYIVRASAQPVLPVVSHVCHYSGPDLFLCDHKSIVHAHLNYA
jgi:hypothetical protein